MSAYIALKGDIRWHKYVRLFTILKSSMPWTETTYFQVTAINHTQWLFIVTSIERTQRIVTGKQARDFEN